MKIDLKGKAAVVTGATHGIGRAIATGLLEAGASVTINARSRDDVHAAVDTLRRTALNVEVRGVAADLGTPDGCAALVKAIPDADILVNNVGIYEQRDFFDTSDDDWQRLFDVNVMSGVRLARHYLRGMLQRDWGRVVFVSSESGINIPADMLHYGFTKAAQLAVSRGLAKLTRGTAVTVNAVLPGPTRTEGVERMIAAMAAEQHRSPDEIAAGFVREHRPSSIIQRLAAPEEVAHMVVYACSPQASATNGAALRVEGGIVDTLV
ncbi:SDR family oxidoreductase [Schlegelella sp. S2-27]|uniref:SDR family oxidoreductase n=1 Tax=Caldimonas mangrovi TaxID=2944811 RepID=A0ABT0YUR6_9BURK|nr:SDR family oxidoreductase [Caldimonas mangrovi]MCM5682491.1 SDR family oxidoreductase [Caldimonas mangrovi]